MRLAGPPLPTPTYIPTKQIVPIPDRQRHAHTQIQCNPFTQFIYQTETHTHTHKNKHTEDAYFRQVEVIHWGLVQIGWLTQSVPAWQRECPGTTGRVRWSMRKAAGILATLTSQGYWRQRAREWARERERGSWRHYRIKQLRSPLASSASLFMWLSGLGLRQNQTPAGHLMIERISELIGRCRGIWTQMTRGTLGCADRHTQAYHTNTREDRTWHT